jgi:trehalose 6-phosphate phosphatase
MSLATRPGEAPPPIGPDWALFLDLDGTLAELVETPDAVRLAPGLADRLARIHRFLGGALAIVSGRSTAFLDRLLAPVALPVVGLHGAEWRARAGGPVVMTSPQAPDALAPLRPLLEQFAARHPGVILEDKVGSLVLHFRQRPEAAAEAEEAARRAVHRLGDRWHTLLGKMMVEIKPRDVDKGSALRRAMAESPFAGRVPAFVGDDLTDEDGFAAVNQAGGYSIKVGSESPSAARYRLSDVDAVHRWLETARDRP